MIYMRGAGFAEFEVGVEICGVGVKASGLQWFKPLRFWGLAIYWRLQTFRG